MEIKVLLYMLVSFISTILVIYIMIPLLYKLKLGQNVYELAPEKHQKKQGLPTMGGIGFIVIIVVLSFFAIGISSEHIFIITSMILFAIIGFIDDSLKVFLGNNDGLSARYKLILQIIVSFIIAYLMRSSSQTINLPFTNELFNLGLIYYPFTVIFFVSLTNSTNLTDGVDGLLASVSTVSFIFIAFITYRSGNQNLFILTLIIIGSLLGYLIFNKYPAKIIMGDTGSMAIGALIASLLMATKTPIYIFLIGIVYIVETLSVILQVWSFKTRGKRIFKMSPIHHHFELSGYSENSIVILFSSFTLIMVIIAIWIYLI